MNIIKRGTPPPPSTPPKPRRWRCKCKHCETEAEACMDDFRSLSNEQRDRVRGTALCEITHPCPVCGRPIAFFEMPDPPFSGCRVLQSTCPRCRRLVAQAQVPAGHAYAFDPSCLACPRCRVAAVVTEMVYA